MREAMIADPLFYLAAVPAVLIAGVSKGGFGGGLGVMAVPLMALFVSPVVAAAIMLPILCVMDLIGIWAYWKRWDRTNLVILGSGAMFGIALGTLSFHYLEPWSIRLLIGAIAVGFTLSYWFKPSASSAPRAPSWRRGGFWGAVAGFTSFTAHAGGPPVGVYLLPQGLEKTRYQATTVVFYLLINYVKLVPYAWLGQFSATNLATSAVLIPAAVAGLLAGVWLHARVSPELFYRVCYIFVFVAGLKLLYDGLRGLWGG